MKKGITKRLVSKILVPATKKYLEKDRNVHFMDMDLHVPSGVFHPSLFFSTKTMCRFLSTIDLAGKKVLEVGAGSGAVSIYAAKRGAHVFCCDINPLAVTTTQLNAEKNTVHLTVTESDLYQSITEKDFDLILNNPPYYPKEPVNMEERAWYAGRNLEFFAKFFAQGAPYLSPGGMIYMVLSDDCNIRQIERIASENSFTGKVVKVRPTLLERSFIVRYSPLQKGS